MKTFIEFINENVSTNDLTIKGSMLYHDGNKFVKTYSDKLMKRNSVFLNDKEIGSFGIGKIGYVYEQALHGNISDPKRREWWKKEDVDNILKNKYQFKNSIYFEGGFGVKEEYRNQGFGKLIIKKVFELYPKIKSIFLYAMNQTSKKFWINTLNGTPILGHKDTDPLDDIGVYLIRLDRNKIL